MLADIHLYYTTTYILLLTINCLLYTPNSYFNCRLLYIPHGPLPLAVSLSLAIQRRESVTD